MNEFFGGETEDDNHLSFGDDVNVGKIARIEEISIFFLNPFFSNIHDL